MESLLPGSVSSSSSVLRILLASPTRDLMEGGGISGIPTPSSIKSRSRAHSTSSLTSSQQQQQPQQQVSSSNAEQVHEKSLKEAVEESHHSALSNSYLDADLSDSNEKLKILSERLHAVSSTSTFNSRINGAAALSLPPLPPSMHNGSTSATSPSTSSSSAVALSSLSPPRANMASNILSPSLVVTPASVESSALDSSTGGGERRRRGGGGSEDNAPYSADSSNAYLATITTSPAARALEFERSLRLSHSRELAMVVDESRRSLESERNKSAALASQLRSAAETEAKLLKQLNDARAESLQNIAKATAAADRAAEGERRASQREMGHLAQISETVAEMQRLRALAETAEATSRMAALMKSESEALRVAEAAAHTLALERAQSSHVLAIERLNASHAAALAKALSEHKSALLEAESQHHAALESVSKNASNLTLQAQTEKISLSHSHELDMAALTARSAAALAEKEAEKSAAISSLKSLHAETLSELNANHASEMASLEASNNAHIKELEAENAALLSNKTLLHTNELNELRLSHSLALSQVKETHANIVNEMKKEFSAEIAQVLLKEKKERENLEASLSKAHHDALLELESAHKKKVADLQDSHSTKINSLQESHNRELFALQESHKRDLSESAHSHALIVKNMQDKFESAKNEYKNEISNLQGLLNASNDDLESRINECNVLQVTTAASIDEIRWTSEKKVAELTLQLDSAKVDAESVLNDFEFIKARLASTESDLTASRERQALSNEELASLKRDLAGAQQDVISLRDRIRYQASSHEISLKEANEALQRAISQRDDAIKFAEMKQEATESQFETKLKDIEAFYREEITRKEASLRLSLRESFEQDLSSSSEKLKATLDKERLKFQEELKNAQSASSDEILQLQKALQTLQSELQQEKNETAQSIKVSNELFETEKSILLSKLKDAQTEDAALRKKLNELENELKQRLADLMLEIARLVEAGQANELKIKAQAEEHLEACMREHKNAIYALNADLDAERKMLKEKTAAAQVLAKRATRALLDVASKHVVNLSKGDS